ncbi:MAG: hypothetical protein P8P74_07875 [Crocinitomicaceae bacterium]|nr:hypothetical protein [Crocinitomicaceae bacterium]
MNKIRIFGLTALAFVALTSFAIKIDLDKKSLLNNRIELKVPAEFNIMSEEMMKIKYPSENRPKLVYSSETGGINVALTLSTSEADQESIPTYLADFKRAFKNAYPSADWKGSGVKTINDRKVGYIELVTPALDTEIYNLMFFTDLDGQLLICSFNCVKKNIAEWKPTAKEIMNSLKVK